MENHIKETAPHVDFKSIWDGWKTRTRVRLVYELADKLDVDYFILDYVGCAWSVEHFAWGFRMFQDEDVVGIRLINGVGHKWVHQYSQDGSIMRGFPVNEELKKLVELLDY